MDANEEELFAPEQLTKPESIKTSLQKLWQKTCLLFWQYPLLLWSPLLVADVAKYWIVIAGRSLSWIAINHLLPHSVLTGRADPLTLNTSSSIIAVIGGVLSFVTYAFVFFLYSLAFIFIANRVHKLTVPPDQIFRLQGTRIFAMASKLTLLLTCSSVVITFLFVWIIARLPSSPTHRNLFSQILLCILSSAAAIFAVRPFLRLASLSSNVTPVLTSRATILTWLLLSGALIASILLELAFMHANISYPNDPSTVFNHLFGLATSLITAMPYIPMMIGIALLAEDERPESHSVISASDAAPSTDLNPS